MIAAVFSDTSGEHVQHFKIMKELTIRATKANDRAALSLQGVLQLKDELGIICHCLFRGQELHVVCQIPFVGL